MIKEKVKEIEQFEKDMNNAIMSYCTSVASFENTSELADYLAMYLYEIGYRRTGNEER